MKQPKRKPPSVIGHLTGEQKAALSKFQKDTQTALPHMQRLARDAQRMHQAMIGAPTWKILDTPRPEDAPEEPREWTVGHAKINYVDHIETEGAQD